MTTTEVSDSLERSKKSWTIWTAFHPPKKLGFPVSSKQLRTWRYVTQETYEGPHDEGD
jgi:hypothetical protein